MFNVKDERSKQLIYLGLKTLIESGKGYGFHNSDQRHPVYTLSAKGKNPEQLNADSPEKNRMYQMLKELSEYMKENEDTNYVWWYDFSEWQKFCEFVIQFKPQFTP